MLSVASSLMTSVLVSVAPAALPAPVEIAPPKALCGAVQVGANAQKNLTLLDIQGRVPGCSAAGSKFQLPSGKMVTIPLPGETIVGSGAGGPGSPETPETFSAMTLDGKVAVGEKFSGKPAIFLGDAAPINELRKLPAASSVPSQQVMPLTAQTTKCSYSTINVNGPGWPSGISYDWWITDNPSYPDPMNYPEGTGGDISMGGSLWTNAQSNCGAYAKTTLKSNFKGTTSHVSDVNSDDTCNVLHDWQSTQSFEKLTTDSIAYTCVYYGPAGIMEADITYDNDQSWAMADNGIWMCSPGQFLLRDLAAHEIGHAIGLPHAPETSGQVMVHTHYHCDFDQATNLGAGDYASLKYLYH